MTTLSTDQDRMLEALLSRRDGLNFGGFAGTGKTTVLAEAARRDPTIIFAAPTNKAAEVLRSKMPKDSDVRTFHKLTQKAELDDRQRLVGFMEGDELPRGTHVIVDEASMIGRKTMSLAQRALGNATVNLVGDPAQLPPVNDDPIFKTQNLHQILTEVYRQDGLSPVLALATRIRETNTFKHEWLDELEIERISGLKLKKDGDRMDELWQGSAQYLCFTNLNRRNMIRAVRKNMDCRGVAMFYARELTSNQPRWHNGSTALVTSVIESLNGAHNIEVEIDGGEWTEEITVYDDILDADKPNDVIWNLPEELQSAFAVATYSYGLTVHKSQGSEWDKVYLQGNKTPRGEDGIRWLYTGITRAANELVWVE